MSALIKRYADGLQAVRRVGAPYGKALHQI